MSVTLPSSSSRIDGGGVKPVQLSVIAELFGISLGLGSLIGRLHDPADRERVLGLMRTLDTAIVHLRDGMYQPAHELPDRQR